MVTLQQEKATIKALKNIVILRIINLHKKNAKNKAVI